MEGVGWIGTIIIGGLAGWIAERVMSSSMGIIGNIILGIVGAVVLNFILVATIGYTYGGWSGWRLGALPICARRPGNSGGLMLYKRPDGGFPPSGR